MLKKALVIDNNEVILKLLVHILKKRGLQVLPANDGLDALEILKSYHPDIIFTDLIMPNIGGEDFCRIISSWEEFSSTWLVVVSAVAMEENIDFQAFGAHACIAKGPAVEMAANIDLIISHIEKGQFDLLSGMRLGSEQFSRRAITRELLASKQHLELILDNIDNGIIEFSRTEKILKCNTFACQLIKTDAREVLGLNLRDVFTGEAHLYIAECLDLFLTSSQAMESKKRIKIGSREIVFKFIGMSENDESSAIMIIRDISKESRELILLQEKVKSLEKLLAEKTKSCE